MSHQQLEPVIWHKKDSKKKPKDIHEARKLGVEVQVEKKFLRGVNRSTKAELMIENKAKIEEEDEYFKVERVAPHFCRALQQARLSKKLSQAQLARMACLNEAIVRDYENGKAIPNNVIIQKLNKALGIQLPSPKAKPKMTSGKDARLKK